MRRIARAGLCTCILVLGYFAGSTAAKTGRGGAKVAPATPAVMWRDPVDISSRNLYYGPGGKEHEPHGAFTFQKEDMGGTNPKFDVVDEAGVKWKVKMGPEARPETAASRLVWAAGYFTSEEYFVPVLHVQKMEHLRRGNSKVSADGTVHDVRLKRADPEQKRIGIWSWAKNPFTDTAELYRLRALMSLMNNWDLKDINNAVYQTGGEKGELRYMVSDLGASFGPTGLNADLKGKPSAYCESKLINRVSRHSVDFNIPSAPAALFYLNPVELARRGVGMRWIGHGIPLEQARWLGDSLAKLSPSQIRDMFRASGYTPEEVEALATTLERRIQELQKL